MPWVLTDMPERQFGESYESWMARVSVAPISRYVAPVLAPRVIRAPEPAVAPPTKSFTVKAQRSPRAPAPPRVTVQRVQTPRPPKAPATPRVRLPAGPRPTMAEQGMTCIECNQGNRVHKGRGLCSRCWQTMRRRPNVTQEWGRHEPLVAIPCSICTQPFKPVSNGRNRPRPTRCPDCRMKRSAYHDPLHAPSQAEMP